MAILHLNIPENLLKEKHWDYYNKRHKAFAYGTG